MKKKNMTSEIKKGKMAGLPFRLQIFLKTGDIP